MANKLHTAAPFTALVKYELAAAHGIVPEQKARDGHRDNDDGPKGEDRIIRQWRLVARPRKLLQERGETFGDRLVGGTVLGPQPLPEFPQPWPSGQDLTRFGLARPTLLALAPKDSSGSRCALTRARLLSSKYPLLLRTLMKL